MDAYVVDEAEDTNGRELTSAIVPAGVAVGLPGRDGCAVAAAGVDQVGLALHREGRIMRGVDGGDVERRGCAGNGDDAREEGEEKAHFWRWEATGPSSFYTVCGVLFGEFLDRAMLHMRSVGVESS